MGNTSIYQSTGGRFVNRKRTLNESWCSYGTRIIKMEDSSLRSRSNNVLRLLESLLHKVLRAPALVARVIQTATRLVTIVLPAMSTWLGRLNGVSKRWGQSSSRYYTGLFINTVRAMVSQLPLLMLLSMDMGNTLMSGNNEFFS